ncbi:4-hydroxy-3-methylbut-2-enyl diphosphate reductase [Porphyromonas gingivalis F0569]|uniref:4-hydroxy-3-methylbut-2-enyl diphosphate reductase n=1 Tax=Porphyromonas gingivalis TaxID=837 RepID=UPI0003AD632B|nr:4-hydroxy-3-methylbut-2-enyl diphosphate reductase [Porphyromonas gingivalis]ATR99815.1 4-hydroxy-3-methylbut-2-enyl diphosphate reductase [Porphyromonas gingivalis]ERJ71513.1 4-hydroxy-3-methylbut-2-enyl diphosphate reductase [Porphyromonas gingivalis F0569]MCE8182597.1 4-hydroxy-3-methylbut-2-enyl diphosphate reductase [Porphyromonas gingivalis]OWR78630.1 4-hydroxy-3-methylbut-2-enyl diphosphate reductase [Porphyromonas gingivalis SJD11]PDP57690.1 4-hydroxy-3-methylbut-2-enyl diphosphate 
MIPIEIDSGSGFCFGVVNAIRHAEKQLEKSSDKLYCLGDIVHNTLEVERLGKKGLETIDYDAFSRLRGAKVLLRAHGEPPEIYRMAGENGVTIIDATCPVVLRLQNKIKSRYEATRSLGAQVVIYGKRGHAEVNGLVGQTEGTAIVIESEEELDRIDYTRPVILFSQTTKSLEGFGQIIDSISTRMQPGVTFEHHDTICRQVANRIPHIGAFATAHELVFFVAGEKSSNGKVLFGHCLAANPRSIFISSPEVIVPDMLVPLPASIGICGATSTPRWQMEEVASHIKALL